jgi:hypothetical protein
LAERQAGHPFVTAFGEAIVLIADERRIFLRACDRCGSLVPCEGDESGFDASQKHADWHARMGT